MVRRVVRACPAGRARILAALVAVWLSGACSAPGPPGVQVAGFESLSGWDLYQSDGHAGNGLRRPSQISAHDGILTITGNADGTTGGLSWTGRAQQYGQWDVRMRAPAGCVCYHPVVLLWGSGGGSGVDNPNGEIDIVESFANARRSQNTFSVHYGDGSPSVGATTDVDMTAWHVYHLVWQPGYIVTWIDDLPPYFITRDQAVLPPGSVDVAIQLDWFPQDGTEGGRTASMDVDSVVQSRDQVSPTPSR